MSSRVRERGTILGGLPVVADVVFGYDSWNMEHWAEVETIYWQKRDGTAGKALPQHIVDKARKYDTGFSCLIEQVSDNLAGPTDEEFEVPTIEMINELGG